MAPPKNESRQGKGGMKPGAILGFLRPMAATAPAPSAPPAPASSVSAGPSSVSAGPSSVSAGPSSVSAGPSSVSAGPSSGSSQSNSAGLKVSGRPTMIVPVPEVSGSSSKEGKRLRVASLSPDRLSAFDRLEKRQRVEDESEYADDGSDSDSEDDDWSDAADITKFNEIDEIEELDKLFSQDEDVDFKDLLADDEPDTVVETDGLIRVGPQPLQPQQFIRSAPRGKARHKLRERLMAAHHLTDRHLPGSNSNMLEQERNAMLESLMISRLCDYSGHHLSWTVGPHTPSIEAVYPFVASGGRIDYHARPNVHLVKAAINFTKGKHAPIVLPLAAAWMNIHDEPNFEERQAQWSWVYNSVTNAATLEKIFGLTFKHVDQSNMWSKWSPAKLRSILETLRTGTKTAEVTQALSRYSSDALFTTRWRYLKQRLSRRQGYIQQGQRMYPLMLQVAQKYDLTPAEFEYYLTIKAPNRPERVFYPYHILSRSQAEAYGWDWGTIIELCISMVNEMKRKCNHHAEDAGYGEDINGNVCIFWMVNYFCGKVQVLKNQRPGASEEEIRFYILDRWNLPLVPWKRHAFKASLCKGPDHGIAMKLGRTTASGEAFDPINDIDLTQSTVELDTWFTNCGMHNYATTDWESIRKTLAAIPLHHSFWRVDLALGETVWKGQ
ncbi:hypothetical protein NW759_008696 [Fusarium solani]|nr:hypothetical protein NW759_008696 [Fusarium solani]